ncbi:MAG: lysine--tRNA ligase [Gaiellales bacterium]
MSNDPESEIRAARLAKLEAMRAAGIDPYPPRAVEREQIAAVRERHESLEAGADSGRQARLAGRITGRRDLGKAMFLDLVDGSGRIQLHAAVDVLGDAQYAGLADTDLGDVVAVHGEVFRSRRGELSVRVAEWRLLAKCLRPLPDKHHGLADVELRLRRRYLDLLANEDSRKLAEQRSRIVTALRRELDDAGFLEVETPVLQPLYGGGAARPFTTFYNEYEREYYLRIATELYLKRLIVGGLERVYELGKDFRNEGVSFKRSPEFTMVEWYEAYGDYGTGMALVERLVEASAAASGSTLDVAPPWPRISLRDAIFERTRVDPMADRDLGRLKAFMDGDGVDTAADHTWAQAVDHLLSHYVEPHITRPTFLVDYPVELSPFAKRSPDDPAVVERFEAFCNGMEFANGYTELNDPADQRARFEEARAAAAAGDEEAAPMDEDFLLALEYGMPPTAGVGIGIDRLVMMLHGVSSIREVILFPPMRERA